MNEDAAGEIVVGEPPPLAPCGFVPGIAGLCGARRLEPSG
jgi:hypothetical protein